MLHARSIWCTYGSTIAEHISWTKIAVVVRITISSMLLVNPVAVVSNAVAPVSILRFSKAPQRN
jgi:hypothetical protein